MSPQTNIKRKNLDKTDWCSDRDEFLWNKEQANEGKIHLMFDYVSMLMLSVCFFCSLLSPCCVFLIFFVLLLPFNVEQHMLFAQFDQQKEKLKRHEAQDILAKEKNCRKQYNCGDSFEYIYFLFARLHVSSDPLNVALSLFLSSDFP